MPGRLPEGLTVLVVEDEALVALNLEAMLTDLGCTVIGPVMRFDRAEELIEKGVTADVAILDVNIGGRKVFDLADMLTARGIPLLFATGYGRAGIPPEFQQHQVLQKPYTEGDVGVALATALSSRVQA